MTTTTGRPGAAPLPDGADAPGRTSRPGSDDPLADGTDGGEVLVVGGLRLDEAAGRVERDGEEIRLTRRERELLRYFMANPRRVLSKTQILDRVWRDDTPGRGNVVELYVSYLRRKIDRGRTPMLHTLRGVGYVLRPAT